MSALASASATAARPGAVLADLLPASSASRARLRDVALVVGGAALTGLAAQLSVPVPGSPVPVTGQTFAALLVGTALGTRRGLASLGLYAVAGVAGLPGVAGGASGWAMPSIGENQGQQHANREVG
jgi:biotin transport system substrate-specific component